MNTLNPKSRFLFVIKLGNKERKTIQTLFIIYLMTVFLGASYARADTWTTLDMPGVMNIYPIGISGNNIVGFYYDDSTISGQRIFYYNGTSWTIINMQGGTHTYPAAISGNNIVGTYHDAFGYSRGFLYDGINWTALDTPWGTRTYPTAISGNNIVGIHDSIVSNGSSGGFLYNGRTWTRIDMPGANLTYPTAISGNNVVGNYQNASGTHGFLYDGTTWTTIDIPGAPYTGIVGISGNNIIASYIDASGESSHGFLYNGTTWINIDVPGVMRTYLRDIDGNNIIGTYYDASESPHGFLYNGATRITLDMPGEPIDIDGNSIIGSYWDTSGFPHGFLYTILSNNPPIHSFPDESTVTDKIKFLQKIPENFEFIEGIEDITNRENIKYLQIVLSEEGSNIYPQSKVSGIYGKLTQDAVNTFIKENHFEGESSQSLGKKTVVKLNNDLETFRKAIVMWRSRDQWIEKTVNKEYERYGATTFGSSFPKSLMFALISAETGTLYNLNNELVSSDNGRGLTQITTADYVGKAYPDEIVADAEGCAVQNTEENPDANKKSCYTYYANTPAGLRRNIGDGLLALKGKYKEVETSLLTAGQHGGLDYSKEDMANISALERYNGIIRQAPAIFLVNQKKYENQQIYDYFWKEKQTNFDPTKVAERGTCTRDFDYCRFRGGFGNDEWLDTVRNVCGEKSFSACLLQTTLKRPDDERYLTTTIQYLTKIAEGLKGFDKTYFNDNLYNKLKHADDSLVITWIASPADLSLLDSEGNQSGFINGQVIERIPNVIVDQESGVITQLLPDNSLRYRVVGTQNGHYGFIVHAMDSEKTVALSDIAISKNSVHEYAINWDSPTFDTNGVTLRIDVNGDGIFEHTVQGGIGLTNDDIILQTKTVVDFQPDSLNLNNINGIATVYIELPQGFDVSAIDAATIMFNGISALSRPVSRGDYNKNDIPDVMVKFDRDSIIKTLSLEENTATATITGKVLHNGMYIFFKGEDIIQIVSNR